MNIRYLGESNLTLVEASAFGGKASKLHDLKKHGFEVPSGFILTSEISDLASAIEKIGGFPVAVRSSCSMEDMDNASFAGLYETFLFVKDHDELIKTIKHCFDSKHSTRVRDYLDTKGIKDKVDDLKMSVLVQKMVDAQIAGVLFTLNPTNGYEEEIYLEYCQGVGERLVSGNVTPSRCTFNWRENKIISHEINAEKTLMSEIHVKELCELSLKIQAHFHQPQDIEWAIDKNGKLHLLQSRPITTYSPREDFPEVTNADFKDGGVSARVCTPLMYSIYSSAIRVSMGEYFKKIKLVPNDEKINWTYFAYGRVYWNAGAVKEGLKKIPGFREEDFDRDLGIQKDYGPNGAYVAPLSFSNIINAIPVLIGLNREFSDSILMVGQFREGFELRDEHLKSQCSRIKKMNDEEYCTWMKDFIGFQQSTEKSYFRIIYNNANFQSEFKGLLKKLKGYEQGDEIDLIGELDGVSHLDVQVGLSKLRKVADFYGLHSNKYYEAREIFLKVHYHHGPAELDLTVARWGEIKEWVDELVKSYVETKHQSGNLDRTKKKILLENNFLKRSKFLKMLETSRSFLRMREEMRAYSTRAYYLLRLGLLEFSLRFNVDVFMLDLNEIRQKLNHPDSVLPNLSLRKLTYEGYRNFKAPNEFGGTIQMPKASNGELRGLGCSPGEMVGIARVITDIHATHNLTKDEILITVFTDPGWTPVLARVGGVVTEVGGLLSHAAVIGREYGIPAILNLNNATKLIQDGDKIKINGKSGLVEILEKRS